MAGDDSYIGIKTRDGSPTLWSNEISEPFRSTKGAFSESWAAFVAPALAAVARRGVKRVVVGEFGLGPGTNWVLWSLAARTLGIDFRYFVIEKETAYFAAGLERWRSTAPEVAAFVAAALPQANAETLARELRDEGRLELPRIYPSLDAAIEAGQSPADLWFHDPFGYAVNPEGYAHQTLTKCAQLWSAEVAGFSYACNRAYREAVEAAHPGVTFYAQDTGAEHLKRQRSEFYGSLYPIPTALK